MEEGKSRGRMSRRHKVTWGHVRQPQQSQEERGPLCGSCAHGWAGPGQWKLLGLTSQLPYPELTIFVARFCPSIPSVGSSTSLVEQGHLWICQLPNVLPINVFYASFNELILVIFSEKLELGQVRNWWFFFFFPKDMSVSLGFISKEFLTASRSLFCFSSSPFLIFHSERCSASGATLRFEFWQYDLGQPFILS